MPVHSIERAAEGRAPWYVWTSLLSVAAIAFGVDWDISWHMSIGRDSFWTPAHLVIQLGGILGGAGCLYVIVTTTFRRGAALRAASVGVWGFRGPLGAFVAAWGAAAMVISAPFDNWWHTAYGLDVKILSPPHAVLSLGILGVATGGVLLIVAHLNRAGEALRRRLDRVLHGIGAAVLVLGMTMIFEYTFRANLHRAEAYTASALVAPLLLLAFGGASRDRWSCTWIAGLYTAFMAGMLWVLPLFPAQPKLGPVYQPITHFIPIDFPILIIVPAFAVDLIRPALAARPRWLQALILGPTFLAVLLAVEWPFASFLMTEHARNRIFGGDYFPYNAYPDWFEVRHLFIPEQALVRGLGVALVAAILASYAGLLLASAMRRARR